MSILEVKEGVKILLDGSGSNIKGVPLVNYLKQLKALDVVVFTFTDENGSFMTIKDVLAELPNLFVVVLLFNRYYYSSSIYPRAVSPLEGLAAKCGVLSEISKRFSVYAIDVPKAVPREDTISLSPVDVNARLLYGIGEKDPFVFTRAEYVGTSTFRDNAVRFMNYAKANISKMGWNNKIVSLRENIVYKVIPFGFNDFPFINAYADYFVELLREYTDISNVFMVLGSGTTLIALYNAFRRILDRQDHLFRNERDHSFRNERDLSFRKEFMPTFHCTVVGKAVDEELIRMECPDIKVIFYEPVLPSDPSIHSHVDCPHAKPSLARVEYYENLPIFPHDGLFHTHQLNYLNSLCPHYDSKLLIGLRKFMIQNGIHIADIGTKKVLLLFVMCTNSD